MGRGQYDRAAARARREAADAAPAAPSPVSTDAGMLPAAIRLTAPHGFIEDVHGRGVFHWDAGEIVTRPATIALLIGRGASWEPVECPNQALTAPAP